MVGVDQYQKNMRTSKYAVLIIALTFLLFFFMEVINKKRIHPIQYLLVGFALCIFYALLLSISEQSSFGLAYIVSSVAVITLVLIYIQGVLKSKRLTLFMGGAMAMIYGFIFIILQLQDFALLVGSVGLFAVLAVIMYYTRHIDWYDINKEK
jgi:inner membrane protein